MVPVEGRGLNVNAIVSAVHTNLVISFLISATLQVLQVQNFKEALIKACKDITKTSVSLSHYKWIVRAA